MEVRKGLEAHIQEGRKSSASLAVPSGQAIPTDRRLQAFNQSRASTASGCSKLSRDSPHLPLLCSVTDRVECHPVLPDFRRAVLGQ